MKLDRCLQVIGKWFLADAKHDESLPDDWGEWARLSYREHAVGPLAVVTVPLYMLKPMPMATPIIRHKLAELEARNHEKL